MKTTTKIQTREWNRNRKNPYSQHEYWQECFLTGRWKVIAINGIQELLVEVEYEINLEHTYEDMIRTEEDQTFLFWKWKEKVTRVVFTPDTFKLKLVKWKTEDKLNIWTSVEYPIQECSNE